MSLKLDGCTALITGASAGIGREFARQLAPRAGALVLVARRADRLEELRHQLVRENPGLPVDARIADLAEPDEITRVIEWLDDQAIEVDLLINNAGVGDHGIFVTGESARVEAMLAVNVVALTLLTRQLLPGMVARKCGAVLNVSSSASFLPIPRMAVYAASKAYVTSFSEALRMELGSSGITVQALCPGPVRTEFHAIAARAGETRGIAPGFAYVPVEQVVRESLRGLERDRALIIPGLGMKFAMVFARITPLALLRLAARVSWRGDRL